MKSGVKHGAGFIVSGVLATLTDAGVLAALTYGAGVDPYSARVVAIALAMVVGYFAHRTLTFAVATPPSLPEFTKFVSVAAGVAVLNYAIYAALLLSRMTSDPVIAFAISSVFAVGASYIGYRFGVFRKRSL